MYIDLFDGAEEILLLTERVVNKPITYFLRQSLAKWFTTLYYQRYFGRTLLLMGSVLLMILYRGEVCISQVADLHICLQLSIDLGPAMAQTALF